MRRLAMVCLLAAASAAVATKVTSKSQGTEARLNRAIGQTLTLNGQLAAVVNQLSGVATTSNGLTNGTINGSSSNAGLPDGTINGSSGGASAGTAHTHGSGSYAVANGNHNHGGGSYAVSNGNHLHDLPTVTL
jgi:hypothetical protein